MGGNAFTSFPSGADAVGGWVELGRVTLGSEGDLLTVSGLPDKRYYMVLYDGQAAGDIAVYIRFGDGSVDEGANYSQRTQSNGGADVTAVNGTRMTINASGGGTHPEFGVSYTANLSGNEKLIINHAVLRQAAGAGVIPARTEGYGKWAHTSGALDTFSWKNFSGGNLAVGAELVVLGWDPTDVHTNNFWEELDSTDFSGSADSFDSGTFTAKKYLWVQCYLEGTADMRGFDVQFNSDTGANYTIRRSHNGAADATFGSTTAIQSQGGDNATNVFWNMFIINKSAEEKLCNIHSVSVATQGAGTSPLRDEVAGKWSNTSSQITSITVRDGSSGKITTGKLRVWGSN